MQKPQSSHKIGEAARKGKQVSRRANGSMDNKENKESVRSPQASAIVGNGLDSPGVTEIELFNIGLDGSTSSLIPAEQSFKEFAGQSGRIRQLPAAALRELEAKPNQPGGAMSILEFEKEE